MPAGSHDRAAYLRVAQRYGPILAGLRRRHAESTAECEATAAGGHRDSRDEPARRPRTRTRPRTAAAEPEPDFSTRTWLR